MNPKDIARQISEDPDVPESLRILILDDDPHPDDPENPAKAGQFRIKQFNRKFIGNIVKWVMTAEEAIAELAENDWDAVFLDHDLGGETYVESGPGTGYEVAVWLERNPDRQPAQIFIHSLNTSGRDRMKAALPKAVIAPFAWK